MGVSHRVVKKGVYSGGRLDCGMDAYLGGGGGWSYTGRVGVDPGRAG